MYILYNEGIHHPGSKLVKGTGVAAGVKPISMKITTQKQKKLKKEITTGKGKLLGAQKKVRLLEPTLK